MFKLLLSKIKESAISVIPVAAIVYLLSFTPYFSMTSLEITYFSLSVVTVIISMGVFSLGAILAMTPMGEFAGAGLIRMKKIWALVFVTFVMGVLVTIAEPDLMVLADQVAGVINRSTLIMCVGIGVGLFLVIGILKMITHKQLSQILMICYMLLFAFVTILYDQGKFSFVPLSFDSGGVTTGPITVPFIMAYGAGIASTIGGRDSNENSFGMVSLSSVGPILVVVLLSIFASGSLEYKTEIYNINALFKDGSAIPIIIDYAKNSFFEVGKAIGLMFIMFMLFQLIILKLPKSKMIQIVIGIFVTLIGLTFFLTSVSVGFLPIGQKIGIMLATAPKPFTIIFAFIIGMTVVLAEPAVQILNAQVEEITGGTVTRKSMMRALSIGVGIAIALSMTRVMFGFSLLYYIVPGYFISLTLSLFVPPIYTSIAFDSGGVASGPLSSTFILPLIIGFCSTYLGDNQVLNLAFGVVSMIAMTPLITIQLLGFSAVATSFVKNRITMNRILSADDNQIIYFEREY